MGTPEISTQWQDICPLSTLNDVAIVMGLDQISAGVSIESISGGNAMEISSMQI